MRPPHFTRIYSHSGFTKGLTCIIQMRQQLTFFLLVSCFILCIFSLMLFLPFLCLWLFKFIKVNCGLLLLSFLQRRVKRLKKTILSVTNISCSRNPQHRRLGRKFSRQYMAPCRLGRVLFNAL